MTITKNINKTSGHFFGGIKLNAINKNAQLDIIKLPPPEKVILPLMQPSGLCATPTVSVGERVLVGQIIADNVNKITRNPYSQPIISTISGIVVAIDEQNYIHESNLASLAITIETDGKDERLLNAGCGDDFLNCTSKTIIDYIRLCGIVGLGGAGFSTSAKITNLDNCHTVIVNGVECEPDITCDDALMQNKPEQIIIGTKILLHISKANKAIIAIENNKPLAIKNIIAANDDSRIEVVVVDTKYISGYEKILIKTLLGITIPANKHSSDMGVLCQNVGTVYAIYDAIINQQPLISRVMSVAGNCLNKSYNYEVRIGTNIADIIADVNLDGASISIGGSMMMVKIKNANYPINKTTNCVLINKNTTKPKEQACIRCGACHQVCPIKLLPQQLYWHSRSQQIDKALDNKLFECIECNCCTFVCPSNIPLTDYFRYAKALANKQQQEKRFSELSKERFEFREQRIKRNNAERKKIMAEKKAKIQQKMAIDNDKKAKIQAALIRAREHKKLRAKQTND